ncbi:Ca2+-dependent phosphoinositide-specific phospholipase C [Paraglaciecola sp.]|uniref:Ca2+-dependent phosphoinositide-specific phospholipase C n=1 Tax=Paraglaciecola sp. TaxID=1920173 RepID=UPI00273D39AE|nr:Ca2+-dependent phosphoinositide-specific phospholipase C [Paraglaciecola sp.]MDP5033290.1 phosphatidylinositol-specific phospholipase C1-like protein [Paraglaciecola sp.]
MFYAGFAYYLPNSAEAAVMVVNNPLTHQLDIQRFNAQGFIMRTRSDEGMIRVPRKENDATKSAAQIMSTDFYSGPSIVLI